MKCELDKEDLISLAKGTTPNYSAMEHPIIKKNGNYSGSYGNWNWKYDAFEDLNEEKIWEIYQVLKNSWK